MVAEKQSVIEDLFNSEQIEDLDKLIELHGSDEHNLIPLLEKVQLLLGYIPIPVQGRIAKKTEYLPIIFMELSLFIHSSQ